MSVLHLWGDVVRLAITNRTQHSDPVQEFAADVAGLQQLVLSGFGDEPKRAPASPKHGYKKRAN